MLILPVLGLYTAAGLTANFAVISLQQTEWLTAQRRYVADQFVLSLLFALRRL